MITLLLLGTRSLRPIQQAGSIGFGACIGAPSGITGKIYLANDLATQFFGETYRLEMCLSLDVSFAQSE